MSVNLAKVVSDFSIIQNTRANVCRIFQDINKKIVDLNKIYMDIVKKHVVKEYTFGLDAFHFQSKLIEQEYENMQKLLNIITNRVYCEYYKLYKIIIEYAHNEIKLNMNIANKTVFPVYKDLEKNINYDFGFTVEIQSVIVRYINAINNYLLTKNKELSINNTRQSKCGINIEHIVHYQSYTNALIAEQIMMFIRYMDALNKHHTKYITRLYTISKHLLDDVNADITTNENDVETENYNENEYDVISLNEHASQLPSAFKPTGTYAMPSKHAMPNLSPALSRSSTATPKLSQEIQNNLAVVGEHIVDEHILGEHILGEHILGEHIVDEHIVGDLETINILYKSIENYDTISNTSISNTSISNTSISNTSISNKSENEKQVQITIV